MKTLESSAESCVRFQRLVYLLLSTIVGVYGETTIQLVWMVPFTSHPESNFVYNASSSVAALALGLQTVYNQSILPGHVFNVSVIDTNCNSKRSIGALVDLLLQQTVDVVIGPPCPQVVQPIGELLAYRDIPLLNWISQGQTIDLKENLDTYIRTMAPISTLGGIMTSFYYYTGWRRLVMISSEGEEYRSGAKTIETNLKDHASDGFLVAHHYSEVSINASSMEIDQILSNIIYEGRILILVIPLDELRTYMLRAHALGMTSGDYQFLFADTRTGGALNGAWVHVQVLRDRLCPLKLADEEDMAIINSDRLWKHGDQYDIAAKQAFQNVLYFALGHSSHDVGEWSADAFTAFNETFLGRPDIPSSTKMDEFAAYLHDTVVLYATTLNMSLTYGITNSGSGRNIFAWSVVQFFKGLSGDVVMSIFGDRQPTFFVYDLNSSGIFHQVASLEYTIDATSTKYTVSSSFTQIVWGDGRSSDDPYIPPDTPACGFFNENCPPETSTDNYLDIILPVCLTMLVVFLALFLVFRWWRNEKKLQNMSWKIDYSQLNFNFSSKKVHSSTKASRGLASSTGSADSSSVSGTIRSGATSVLTPRHSITRGQIFTTVAMLKGEMVALKWSTRKKLQTDRVFLLKMKHLSELKHANLTTFIGVCTGPEKICTVWEYCSKGSLQDVIENDDINLDTMFKLSLALDICQGLEYIHKSSIRTHGNLRSSNCVIDNRWVCKLTDFGVQRLRPTQDTVENIGEHAFYARLFWTAPEILRKYLNKESFTNACEADIYALGVILKELLCRNEPYCAESSISPKEIITKVTQSENEEDVFRPAISDTGLESEYSRTNMEYLIQRCWTEDPDERPAIKSVIRTLNKLNPYKKSSVVDNMIAMMEKYTNNLEEIVAERTEQLQEEKLKTDALLYRMLPRKVAEDLKIGRAVQAEAFDSVTIYFSDIVRFTDLAGESTPLEIVGLLNALYTLFDAIIAHYNVYKVETIGDAYMIASGLPERNGNLHVKEIAGVALSILQSVKTFEIPHRLDRQLEIRIGLHTGSVVAGVVGLTMPRYCLFGDTVNTASRMESNGKPLRIHISSNTKMALDEFPEFIVEERGEIPIKGKGMMRTYWLSGLYLADDEVCVEADQFQRLLEPDKPSDDNHEDQHTAHAVDDSGRHGVQTCDKFEGKISVADSGICMNKGLDEKNGTMMNYTDFTSAEYVDAHYSGKTDTGGGKDNTDSDRAGDTDTNDDGYMRGSSDNLTLSQFFCDSHTFSRQLSTSEDLNSGTCKRIETTTEPKDKTNSTCSTDRNNGPYSDINYQRHSEKGNTKQRKQDNRNEDRIQRINNADSPLSGVDTLQENRDNVKENQLPSNSENEPGRDKLEYSRRTSMPGRFRRSERNSITDFMTVHNNWFTEDSFHY